MLSIWALRVYFGVLAFLIASSIFASLRHIKIDDLFLIIIIGVILIINIDLFCIKNIVYLTDDTIMLKGIFNTKVYLPEDFVRLSVYNKWLSVTFIEFADGKKYHILTKEIPLDSKYRDTFKDYTHTAAYLDFQIRDYFKNSKF